MQKLKKRVRVVAHATTLKIEFRFLNSVPYGPLIQDSMTILIPSLSPKS